MAEAFPHLFQPLALRHRTLKHRLNFGAHTANMAEGGLPGARHLHYYLARARGGAAMIVVEPVPAHRSGVLKQRCFRPEDDAIVPHFRAIVEACQAEGAVMVQQISHVGQHGDADNSFHANWSPSGLPSYYDADGSQALSEAQIEELIAAYGQAARRAREAGYDGVEIFAAYHGLVDQFWTPWSNRRDDRWGGTLENRCRFSRLVLERVRAEVGEDFILGLAVALDEDGEVTLSREALQEIVAWHDERGLMDYVTCGTGSYFDFASIIPTSPYPQKLGAEAAGALKAVVKHAKVQAESHIRTAENAEEILAAGQADMVSLVRAQIADPQLAEKARTGRSADVRPCISCNQLCWGRRARDYWISCLVNPSAGREFEWGGADPTAAERPRRILVVGGGPAGLECARVAAARGHRVTLAEQQAELGGQFRLSGRQPSRQAILDLIAWHERQLRDLQVELRCGTAMTAAEVAAFGADAVVLATGARPTRTGFQRALPGQDRLPGAEHESVSTIHQVLAGESRPEGRILVLDDLGDWRGIGTALLLAEAGQAVTLATSAGVIAKALERTAADVPLRKRFARAGGRALTGVALLSWHAGTAEFRHLLNGEVFMRDYRHLVLATMAESDRTLAEDLADSSLEVHAIGDCVAPRKASMAFYEGRKLGLEL